MIIHIDIKNRKYFTFLPNMITLFNLFTGFLSILMVSHGHPRIAAWLIVLSLIWDSLDGNISRIFKNPTALGRELDSLADIVSFVVTPAFLAARFLLPKMNISIILLLFLYLAAGAYRLARFNLRPPVKDYFEGLPTPAAAVTLAMTVLSSMKNGWTGNTQFGMMITVLLILLSVMMVSHIRYPKVTAIQFKVWRSLLYLISIIFFPVFVFFNAETALASGVLIFVFLAPVYCMPYQPQTSGDEALEEPAE